MTPPALDWRSVERKLTRIRLLVEPATGGEVGQFAGVALDISQFPTRHPYSLGLWQNHIERILAGWVGELPVTVRELSRRSGGW